MKGAPLSTVAPQVLAMANSCSRVSISLVLLIISFSTLSAWAQIRGIVPQGSNLTANEASSPWLSPSGDYAFGFRQLNGTDLFLLSIWYPKIPDKTVVWYINSDTSTSVVARGSTVQLGGSAGLTLRDPQGQSIWTPNGITRQISQGFMNDTGNFVLMASDGSWEWQSFGSPSDTMLPSQELALGGFLNSSKSETNFSQGGYYLQFGEDGNVVLASRNVRVTINNAEVVYYNSQTSDTTNSSNSGYRFLFDDQGSVSIVRRNNQTVFLETNLLSPSQNYLRLKLEFHGVLTLYSQPKNLSANPVWTVLWSVPGDICRGLIGDRGSGPCGYNNICNFLDGKPVCTCPTSYTLTDPTDEYGSCKPNSTVNCEDPTAAVDQYDFVELTNVDWPLSDFEQINPVTEGNCKQACQDDCFCAVSIFRDNSCWKKRLPLSNGRVDTSLNSKVFIKYSTREANTSSPTVYYIRNEKKNLILVGSVLLGSSLFVNLILIVGTCLGFYLIYRKRRWAVAKFNNSPTTVETNLRYFTSREIVEATKEFKEEMGRGASGIVYKGEIAISDGSVTVAVKKLDKLITGNSDEEFRAEMNSIARTNHKNLVRLLGFCDEGPIRCLVYEYMTNGSLSSFIFTDQKPSWKLRTRIAIGVARGLAYLHDECTAQIIHCDVKPQNILLDEYYNARISDFGLAKLLPVDKSMTLLSQVRGTRGYVAPEWFRPSNSQISSKVDVYSFGVLLLEIISCRRCIDEIEIDGENYGVLTDIAWECLQQKRLDILVQNDPEALQDLIVLERFVMAGIWCIQENVIDRPTMRTVTQMLEGVAEVSEPPAPYPVSSVS